MRKQNIIHFADTLADYLPSRGGFVQKCRGRGSMDENDQWSMATNKNLFSCYFFFLFLNLYVVSENKHHHVCLRLPYGPNRSGLECAQSGKCITHLLAGQLPPVGGCERENRQ